MRPSDAAVRAGKRALKHARELRRKRIEQKGVRRRCHLITRRQTTKRKSSLGDCLFDRHIAAPMEPPSEGVPPHEEKVEYHQRQPEVVVGLRTGQSFE